MVRRDTADIAADMMHDINAAEKNGEYFFDSFIDFLGIEIKTELCTHLKLMFQALTEKYFSEWKNNA